MKLSIAFFCTSSLLLCFSYGLSAQQLPVFTQYREAHGIVNPASLNVDYLIYQLPTFVGATVRTQWVGQKSSPKTQAIFASHLLEGNKSNLLLGAHLMNDRVGRVGTTGFTGRAAVLFSDDPEQYGFSAGINVGVNNYRVDLSNAVIRDADDLKAQQNQSVFYPDAGLGIFGYQAFGNHNFMYGGLSIPQLLGLDLKFGEENGNFAMKQVRHFYGHGGCMISLKDDYSFLEFSTWIKYVHRTPINVDLNVRYRMGDFVWFGTGYNTAGMLHLEVGFVFQDKKMYKLGYGNSTGLTKLKPYFGNTHDLNISTGF